MISVVPIGPTVLPQVLQVLQMIMVSWEFYPKGPLAHGTMSLALPFCFEGTHYWGPSRARIRGLIALHTIPEGQSFITASEPFTDVGL